MPAVVGSRTEPARADAPATARSSRARLLYLGGGVLVLVQVVIAVIAIVVFARRTTHTATRPAAQPIARPRSVQSAPVPASGPAESGAIAWVTRHLVHDAAVLTDAGTGTALAPAGFTHLRVVSLDHVAEIAPGARYVVSTPALRASASRDAALTILITRSVPIAAFGTGSDQVLVRQTTTIAPAEVATRQRADAFTRADAETQLLANPSLQATGSASTALRAGRLDLRAATVLAMLAGHARVELLAVTADPAERAAGVPDRVLEVRTTGGPPLHSVLATLPAGYRISSEQRLPNHVERLTWPVEPVPPVGSK